MINETQLKKYCSEDISKIENYEQAINDKTQTWHCHHRLEIQGQFRNSTALLKKCGLYYNVPASQLIFLTHDEHARLHRLGEKGHMSEETKKKISMSLSGKHHSEETKKKISLLHSGEKHPMFGKRGEKCPVFGTQWWNNGAINKRSKECPGQGWVRGRIKFLRKTK